MNILELKKVGYKKEEKAILQDISLQVSPGDCLSIVGASGSGKSTLLKLCSDLISPTSGEIYFKGKPYADYEPIQLRRKISYCLQTPILFGKQVAENLNFPFKIRKEAVDQGRIIQLLERFNLNESFLEKEIQNLSGGEKQRIAIIRHLLYEPEILLLDEATSALDTENAKMVETYIQELNQKGVTILWVTHQLEQSRRIFNKRIIVGEGNILEEEELIG